MGELPRTYGLRRENLFVVAGEPEGEDTESVVLVWPHVQGVMVALISCHTAHMDWEGGREGGREEGRTREG